MTLVAPISRMVYHRAAWLAQARNLKTLLVCSSSDGLNAPSCSYPVQPWLKESDILMDNEVSKKMVKIVGSDAYMADACTQLIRP